MMRVVYFVVLLLQGVLATLHPLLVPLVDPEDQGSVDMSPSVQPDGGRIIVPASIPERMSLGNMVMTIVQYSLKNFYIMIRLGFILILIGSLLVLLL